MRLYLHIGTEKTGTTSLQGSLASSAARLAGLGYFFTPTLLGNANNSNLVVVAGALTDPSDYFVGKALSSMNVTLDRLAAETREKLAEALGARPYHTAIFSSEHLHSRMVDVAAKKTLRQFLLGLVDEVKVVVYLRRQDSMAVSDLSTRVIDGVPIPRTLIVPSAEPARFFDYGAMVEEYAEVFGAANIIVRLYERDALVDGNVVADFERLAGMPANALDRIPGRNVSFSIPALEFLDEYNALHPKVRDGKVDPARAGRLAQLVPLLRRLPGPRPVPRPLDVAAFLAPYEAGNRRILREFFPGRPALFSDDYRLYPKDGILLPDEETAGRRAGRAAAALDLA